ncbi:hypothetical protein ES703_109289 [subsurface metagenome]
MDFVRHHMVKLLVITDANEDVRGDHFASDSVIHDLLTCVLKPVSVKHFAYLLFRHSPEWRAINSLPSNRPSFAGDHLQQLSYRHA